VTLLVTATATSSLRLEQHIRYDYSAPVERLRQRLIVLPPPVHGAQRRGKWSLTVDGVDAAATVRRSRTDRFGNAVVDITARRVERWIRFAACVEVARVASGAAPSVAPAAAAVFLQPTPLTTADTRIRDLVGPDAGATPARICSAANRALTYEWGVTGVHTTAADAIRGGRGVCQDFAHVMIAACRAAGIAARYVSGHLVGEGGSHAWVEAMVPHPDRPGEWAVEAWDPTHDRRADDGYLTVAVGRDYADVAPMSGSYVADQATGRLTVRKRLVAQSA
jgi:transglutaminase-like putative cysteine protease